MSGQLQTGVTYSQAPRLQPNLGRPWYAFAKPPPPIWRSNAALRNAALPLPSWIPDVWTKVAESPMDNSRSAMVRDNHDVQGELAQWDKRLRTHIASFSKEVAKGTGNVVALPPLSSSH
jgi:hypothetical protein